jgi:hypothetical protein
MAAVDLVVTNCREAESGWEIGCQFVKVPAAIILWQFG